jgi:hypothetical protein
MPSLAASASSQGDKKRAGETLSDLRLNTLLRKAKELYTEAGALPKPTDTALYLTELAQVSGLLAYTNPENSDVAPYLTQERREEVADQVDKAILCKRRVSCKPSLH